MSLKELNKKLETACYQGDLEGVEKMIRNDPPEIPEKLHGRLDLDNALYTACSVGNLQIARLCYAEVQRTCSVVNQRIYLLGAIEACGRSGSRNLTLWCIGKLEKFENQVELNPAFVGACRGGHQELAKWLLEQMVLSGKAQLGNAFTKACEGDHADMAIMWVLPWYPSFGERANFSEGLYWACKNGNASLAARIVELVTELSVDNLSMGLPGSETSQRQLPIKFERGLYGACRGGHPDLAQWCLDWMARVGQIPNMATALVAAIRGRRLEMAKWCVDERDRVAGVTHFAGPLKVACEVQDSAIIKWCIEMGATELNRALQTACGIGDLELGKWLVERCTKTLKRRPAGIDCLTSPFRSHDFLNFAQGLVAASRQGQMEMAEWCVEMDATCIAAAPGTGYSYLTAEDIPEGVASLEDNPHYSPVVDGLQFATDRWARAGINKEAYERAAIEARQADQEDMARWCEEQCLAPPPK